MPTNDYLQSTDTFYGDGRTLTSGGLYYYGGAFDSIQQVSIEKKQGDIHPELYFKFIKKKFGLLDGQRFNKRIKALETAFDKAVESGQSMLSEKVLEELVVHAKESAIYSKGFKLFIEKEDLNKYKNKIRDGHISDTQLKDFTRVIPDKVLDKKKKTDGLFDGYVIYHYWNQETEDKTAKKQKMSSDEKARMRDPVLFGWIKETNRLYFIADWEDEYCDLSFEEVVDHLGKSEEDITLPRVPQLRKEYANIE